MAMGQYQGVGGVARRVTRRYQGVAGIARQVVRACTGVDGVARQYFAAGVPWQKWSCQRVEETGGYEQVESSGVHTVGDAFTTTASAGSARWASFSAYSFDSDTGFSMTGYGVAAPETIVGRYQGGDDVIYQCIACEDHGDGTYTLTWEYIGLAVCDSWYSYQKGDTGHGVVYGPEGGLPEDGELLEGSAAGSYCVLLVDGVYYYYEREEAA